MLRMRSYLTRPQLNWGVSMQQASRPPKELLSVSITGAPSRRRPFGRAAGHDRALAYIHAAHYLSVMHLTVETDREEDGRWIAEVPDLAGVLAYGETRDQAIARAEALALRVLADRLEHAEAGPDLVSVSFRAA